jgi:hypothetical protein
MKKLWLLALASALIAVAVGCAKEEVPPVANPTGEKSADDKSAAGDSGTTVDPKGATPTSVTSNPEPGKKSDEGEINRDNLDKRMDKPDVSKPPVEKPADDSGKAAEPVIGKDGKKIYPPGTPIPKDEQGS